LDDASLRTRERGGCLYVLWPYEGVRAERGQVLGWAQVVAGTAGGAELEKLCGEEGAKMVETWKVDRLYGWAVSRASSASCGT